MMRNSIFDLEYGGSTYTRVNTVIVVWFYHKLKRHVVIVSGDYMARREENSSVWVKRN